MTFADDSSSERENSSSGSSSSGASSPSSPSTGSTPPAEGGSRTPDAGAAAPPEAPRPYGPGETERGDFRKEAVDRINEVADQQADSSRERYRGLFGRINEYFNSEGKRTKAETLEQVGEWEKNPGYKKWIRIGAMAAGGLGIAAAMTLTGGAGAVLTPLLWSMGVRAGWNSVLETVEQLHWGRGRSKLELESQDALSIKIKALKEVVKSGDATRATYEQALNDMLESQRQVSERQTTIMTSEHRWALGRSIASSVLTIGTGVFAGVPLGTHHYKGIDTYHFKDATGHNFDLGFDQAHRTFWNFRGGQFVYNQGEMGNVNFLMRHTSDLQNVFHEHFNMASHALGHGLPGAEKWGLGLAGALLAGSWLEQYLPTIGGRKRRTAPAPGPYGPPYRPGGPEARRPGQNWWEDPTYRAYLRWMRDGGARPWPVERRRNADGTSTWLDRERHEIRRDVNRERAMIHEYFERHRVADRGRYSRELDGIIRRERFPEMSEHCRVAVLIPAFHEEANIYNLLQEYSRQVDASGNPLDTNLFELNVIVNRPSNVAADKTLDEVRRFQREHPEIHIVAYEQTFPKEKAGVSIARKYMTDLILKRSLARARQSSCLYIESEDADVIHVDPKTVHNIISKMDGSPHLDAVRGTQDRLTDLLKDNDLTLLERRAFDILENTLRRARYRVDRNNNWSFAWNRTVTGGWNTAYSAEAYCLAGGYNPALEKAEDMDIGLRISMVRGREHGGRIVPRTDTIGTVPTRSISSPRRFLQALVSGVGAYENFSDPTVNQRIRKLNEADALRELATWKRIVPGNKARFEQLLTSNFSFLAGGIGLTRENSETVFKRTMVFLGFKDGDWHVDGDRVVVDNVDNFKNACESYRRLGPMKVRVFEKALEEGVNPERFDAELTSRGIISRDFDGLPDAEKDEIRRRAA